MDYRSTGELFGEPLPIQNAPNSVVRLIGPYARQELGSYRIKFWFAMTGHRDGTRRYELAYTLSEREPIARFRGHPKEATFRKQAVPVVLSNLPSIAYPRHKGDRLELAMQSMLTGVDMVDALRLSRFGIMPAR